MNNTWCGEGGEGGGGVGLSQLCWHNFRIIGTSLGGFSIKNNARIIGRILAQLGGGAAI